MLGAIATESPDLDRAWMAEPPGYDAFLPGGACTLRFTPQPRRRLGLGAAHFLHGAVSTILGESGVPHHERWPVFTIALDALGSATLVLGQDDAGAVIANGRFPVRIGSQENVTMQVGPLTRHRAPIVHGRGPRLLRITAETPVVVRRTVRNAEPGHRGGYHTTPTTENLRHSIGPQFAERLGLGFRELGRLELVHRDTQGTRQMTGPKVRLTWGWLGSVVVRVDAQAEWLLRAAETLGLGGRTAFGFGRVQVEPFGC